MWYNIDMGRHKGSIAWNKGIPFSEESRLKMSLAHKGQHNSIKTEFKKDNPSWNTGLTKDTDDRLVKSAVANSKAQSGKVLSNATKAKIGLAATGKKHTDEAKSKISQANKGKHLTDKQKQVLSLTHKGIPSKCKGRTLSLETRDKISESVKLWFKQNPEKAKQNATKNGNKGAHSIQQTRLPTEIEGKLLNILNKILPGKYKYVGNRAFWINKGNPDFMNYEKKKLIEVFYPYYKIEQFGSIDNYKEVRHAQFAKRGFDTLFVSSDEIHPLKDLKERILEFNGV